jgi:hypothetical protein
MSKVEVAVNADSEAGNGAKAVCKSLSVELKGIKEATNERSLCFRN